MARRHARRRRVHFLSDGSNLVRDLDRTSVQMAGGRYDTLSVGRHGRLLRVLHIGKGIFADENAAAERRSWKNPKAKSFGRREKLVLHGPLHKAVLDLQRHERRHAGVLQMPR